MLAQGRYVRKDARIYHDSHCLYCGACCGICKGEARACRVYKCLACGTAQCSVNGLARGQCSVCFSGLLEGWSGSNAGQPCTYKGCIEPAVARGRGRKNVCAAHIERQHPGFFARADQYRNTGFVFVPAADVAAL